jgi:hypothetical protein
MLIIIVEQQRAISLANAGYSFELPDFHLLSEILTVFETEIITEN